MVDETQLLSNRRTVISGARDQAMLTLIDTGEGHFAIIDWPWGEMCRRGQWSVMTPDVASEADARRMAQAFADRFGLDLVEDA